MSLAEIYLKAADVIRANGHYKGAYWGRPESGVGVELAAAECPVCTVGALGVATNGHPVPAGELPDLPIMRFARRMFGPVSEAEAIARIAAWNDTDERTSDDVIAAFERVAREVAA